jgi:ABC-type transport system substrate-binding protein
LVLLGAFLGAGCSNYPHPPPLHPTRQDGEPWRVLYRALPDDPRSIDPQHAYDTISDRVVRAVYETPLQYAPFDTDPFRLEPCLLESMPERTPLPDGAEAYTFRIKRGLRFHDDPCFGGRGRAVTSRDFRYAFQRIADPRVECPVSTFFMTYVKGLREAHESAKRTGRFDYDADIAGLETPDDHTLRIILTKPCVQMAYWFAMPVTAPVPREAVEYYDGKVHDGKARDLFRFHPVGTGPFQLVERAKGRLLRFKRFEGYLATRFPEGGWAPEQESQLRKQAGSPLPLCDEVQFVIIREYVSQWRLFSQGYLETSGVAKDAFKAAIAGPGRLTEKYRSRGVTLHRDSDQAVYYFVFNMEDRVVGKNRKLRQALSRVIDVERMNQIFFNGLYLDAQQLLPPGVFGHDPSYRHPYKGGDVEAARQLLAEAGFPEGRDPASGRPLELALDVTADDPTSRQMALFYKQQIEQLGIRLNIVENLFATQLDKMDRGNFQIVQGGWNADYPDPENFFMLLYGANLAPAGPNYFRFRHAEFDRLFEEMKVMENTPERLARVRRMNDILAEEVPLVLLSSPVVYALTQPWAPRVTGNTMLGGGLKYANVDVALRESRRREWNRPEPWAVPALLGVLALLACGGWALARRPA